MERALLVEQAEKKRCGRLAVRLCRTLSGHAGALVGAGSERRLD